jgi:DNA gyrase subunit A
MIRVDMNTIRKAGRNTSGVTIVNVDKNDKVVSIAKCPKEKDDELDIQLADDMAGIDLEERNLIPTEEEQTPPSSGEQQNLLDIDEDDK